MGAAPAPRPGGSTKPEDLIRRAHLILESHGIALSPGKVSRLVREYRHKVADHRIAFDRYLIAAAAEVADHRARQHAGKTLGPDEKSGHPTAHSDRQTGEPATWNVFSSRGY